uniref:E3 ubiquitin-protein ligase RNF186 n=1 Tax=Geotrypetes seraphini TaxID=260995 RepID=A0A6P8NPZ2_GEOSA|nr:E3 ubiquitin-protein ligase RNF186 [Geotrypetes seraphini]
MAAADCIDLPVSPVVETDSLNSICLLMDGDSPTSPATEPECLDFPYRSATENRHVISATEKDCSDHRKSPTAKTDCSESPKPSATMMDHIDFSKPSVVEPDDLWSPLSCAEMDCPVCFTRYSINRAPKLLACQHIFCAVCLKLLVRNKDGTWLITCPLCRTSTLVFGGSICSLQTREDLMDPSSNAGVRLSPQEGVLSAESCNSGNPDPDDHQSNITALARRLMVLLLILAILVVIVLQFTYAGLLKWVLCFTAIALTIMSVVLCSRINFRRALRFINTHKDSQIVSAA